MKTDEEICHALIDMCKSEGRNPQDTTFVLLAAAATVTLLASSAKKEDFLSLAGDVFTHFAKANSDIRRQ